jgi:hypothetical protein
VRSGPSLEGEREGVPIDSPIWELLLDSNPLFFSSLVVRRHQLTHPNPPSREGSEENMFKAKLYGEFAVKFRAFGIDLGYVKRSISLGDAVVFSTPIALPSTVPLLFEKFGIRVDAYLMRA